MTKTFTQLSFVAVQGDVRGFDDDGNAAHGYDDEYLDSAGEEELMDSGGEREDDKVCTVILFYLFKTEYFTCLCGLLLMRNAGEDVKRDFHLIY